ncbi:UNVERIFIED_CONTAM: hypothetical protein FKN15_042829 [Acipenser sinensis]
MAESSLCQKKEECFPAHATVLTSDGSRRTMAELHLGDRMLAVDTAGQFTFSEVLLWLDLQSGARERYLLLDTEGSEETLYITPDHVLFTPDNATTSATATHRVPAFTKDILPGHLLNLHDPSTGSLEAKRVIDVLESESLRSPHRGGKPGGGRMPGILLHPAVPAASGSPPLRPLQAPPHPALLHPSPQACVYFPSRN